MTQEMARGDATEEAATGRRGTKQHGLAEHLGAVGKTGDVAA